MKTIIMYGYPEECARSAQYLNKYLLRCFSEQEKLVPALMEQCPAAVWIVMKKAAGMEGVIAVRRIYPDIPIVWFSNDGGFAPQAYRLNVNYFALMPVSEDKIRTAIKKCGLNV